MGGRLAVHVGKSNRLAIQNIRTKAEIYIFWHRGLNFFISFLKSQFLKKRPTFALKLHLFEKGEKVFFYKLKLLSIILSYAPKFFNCTFHHI